MRKRIKISDNFYLDEYTPKELYQELEHKPHILRGLIDRRLVEADQMLRDIFGPTTINNWWHGGDRNWSGLRTPDSPVYSPNSQHTFGRASDKLYKNATASDVRAFIKKKWQTLGIKCIEDEVYWVHSDVRWVENNELLIVKP